MIHKIANAKLAVSIDSFGAELSSIKKSNSYYEYLWQGSEDSWVSRASILFPLIGRLKGKSYTYIGKEYDIASHGFARATDFEVAEKKEDSIIFSICSNNETLGVYPFEFKFSIKYSLVENKLVKEQVVENLSNEDMLYEVGGHDGYSIAVSNDENMTDYYFEFTNGAEFKTYTFDENLMLDEEMKDVVHNENVLPISMELFKDDALVMKFDDVNARNVKLLNKSGDYSVEVDFKDFKYLGLWTRYLDYETKFVCVEPWTSLPDCNFLGKELDRKVDIERIGAGESKSYTYTVEVK